MSLFVERGFLRENQAWAVEIEPAKLSLLAQTAAMEAFVGLAEHAVSSSVETIPSMKQASMSTKATSKPLIEMTENIERGVSDTTRSAIKEHWKMNRGIVGSLVVGAVALLTLIGIVLTRGELGDTSQKTTVMPIKKAVVIEENLKDEQSTPSQSRVAAQWQSPRFIKGNYAPCSIAVAGQHVVLLARDYNKNNFSSRRKMDILFKYATNACKWGLYVL